MVFFHGNFFKKPDGRFVVQLFNPLKSIMAAISSLMWATCHWSSSVWSRVQTRGWTAFSFRARNAAASGPFSQAFIGRTAHHRSWWRYRTQSSRVCGKLPVSSFLSVAGACGGPIHPNPPSKIFQNPSKNRWSTKQNIPSSYVPTGNLFYSYWKWP